MIAARVVNRCSSFSRKSPPLSKRAAAMLGVCLMVVALPTAAHAQSEAVESYGLDALGSVRVVFDANGNLLGRMDYGPFGQALVPSTGKQQNIYAGLFADGNVGLDHADARSYQIRTGRFSNIDPVYGGLFEPQLWNRYAYAANNPAVMRDPGGDLPSIPFLPCLVAFCTSVRVTAPAPPPVSLTDYFSGSVRKLREAFVRGLGQRSGSATQSGSGAPLDPETDGTGSEDDGGEVLDTVGEACIGGAQGFAGFVDGVVPFGNPLMSAGAYNPGSPADWWSQGVGAGVRDFALGELVGGALLGQIGSRVAQAAKAGNPLAKLAGNNRFVRLGQTFMGGPGKTVALRLGNAQSAAGKWLTHVDLRVGQVFSKNAPQWVKKAQQCLRLR